ncbi:FAD-dependent oxidoreductase [Pseudomonas indica]|uniref:FAD-dependent oxidoreductase n=1 Tax=Pseudomonas indica TaxID=137658 RepID=UPI000BD4EC7D|nr:FAD-dependent oxidoreductase [Pseudomonas indica]PAU65342.1 hypothetical protein BZL42_00470 [Pseudomonas indica]
MQTARIAIIGAGLSGLYVSFLLEQRGSRDYMLLEARDGPCGRILSVSPSVRQVAAGAIDRFDLGPSWFWPGYQHQLDRLVRELGLARFEQFEAGDMLVEHSLHEPPRRMRGYVSSPPSMRLVGGMEALIDALHRRLDATRIVAGQKVRRLRSTGQHLELDSEDATGRATILCVEHVLLAMPPRLVEESIQFSPALPPVLARQWRARWVRFTTPPCRVAARHCLACRCACARTCPRTSCVRFAAGSSRGCSDPWPRRRRRSSSRVGRWTRTPPPSPIWTVLPSFFTGALITRFGVRRIMLTGVLLFVDHILMTLTGMGFGSFASALVLLGVGWNFLYIGGTALLTGTYSPAERRGHKPSMTW